MARVTASGGILLVCALERHHKRNPSTILIGTLVCMQELDLLKK